MLLFQPKLLLLTTTTTTTTTATTTTSTTTTTTAATITTTKPAASCVQKNVGVCLFGYEICRPCSEQLCRCRKQQPYDSTTPQPHDYNPTTPRCHNPTTPPLAMETQTTVLHKAPIPADRTIPPSRHFSRNPGQRTSARFTLNSSLTYGTAVHSLKGHRMWQTAKILAPPHP